MYRSFITIGLVLLLAAGTMGWAPAANNIVLVVMPAQAPPDLTNANLFRQQTIQAIHALGFYDVCPFNLADSNDPTLSGSLVNCTLASASVLVRPTIDSKGHFILGVLSTRDTSFSVIPDVDLGAVPTTGTGAIDYSALNNAFGKPRIESDGTLSLGLLPTPASYQQGVQLIPLGPDAPNYIGDVAHMLALRGVTAVDSGITGVTLAASTPDSAICNAGQQYFAYAVNLSKDPKPLIGFTRVGAAVDGWLFDCVQHRMLSDLGADDRREVPTLSASIAQYALIVGAFGGFRTWNLTPRFAVGLPLVATFGSVDPDNADIKHHVGELALQRLIDKVCNVAATTYADIPDEESTSSNDQNGQQHILGGPGGAAPAPAPAPPAAPNAQTLINFNSLTGPNPYHVHCNSGATNAVHIDKGIHNPFQFYGWLPPRPAPTPLPTASPVSPPAFTFGANTFAAGLLTLAPGTGTPVTVTPGIANMQFVSKPDGCAVVLLSGSTESVTSFDVALQQDFKLNACSLILSGSNGMATLNIRVKGP